MKVVGFNSPHKCNCKKCGAIIKYQNNEIKSYKNYCYDGSSDLVYYIECPNCSLNVVVKY